MKHMGDSMIFQSPETFAEDEVAVGIMMYLYDYWEIEGTSSWDCEREIRGKEMSLCSGNDIAIDNGYRSRDFSH